MQFENILSLLASPHKEPLTKEMLADQFPDVFQGTGKLSEPCHLQIDPIAKPVVHPPRNVPLALKTALKEEFDRLESLQIVTQCQCPGCQVWSSLRSQMVPLKSAWIQRI